MQRLLIVLAICCAMTDAARADVKVPRLFSDNMVVQRGMPIPVWGTAEPGEKVTVKFAGNEAAAEAGADGRWKVKLPATPMNGQGQNLLIEGKNKLSLQNVLIGDVWLCSGQSNMAWNLNDCNSPEDIAAATLPTIRGFSVPTRTAPEPQDDIPSGWQLCLPDSSRGFSGVGFFFARRINKETGVPIGLLNDAWSGSMIEPWIPPAVLDAPDVSPVVAKMREQREAHLGNYRRELGASLDGVEKWLASARQAIATGGTLPASPPIPNDPRNQGFVPTSYYNTMVYPLVQFPIKGVIWYQGESNGGDGDEYAEKMRALIEGWRKQWNEGDFPFYFVQLANIGDPNEKPEGGDGWSKIRCAQAKAMQTIPHTGMASAIDVGTFNDIHPRNKFDVGERLARWALKNEYGKSDLEASGPIFQSQKIEGNKIRLTFDHIGGGLIVGKKTGRQPTEKVEGGKLKHFAIAGEDKKWVWADATIDGDTVIVSSPEVAQPVAVRYAFSPNPDGANLYNAAGLPASPFRTDSW